MARGFFWKMAREGWAGRLAGAPERGWGVVGCGVWGGVRRQGVRAPGEGGTVGRQVSTSGARAYTARCPRPGRV